MFTGRFWHEKVRRPGRRSCSVTVRQHAQVMKVSIVTAVRNGAPAIAATIRSVLAQTHQPLEHVFVDGASTDATLETINSETLPGARIISEPDSGVYDAFNKGLRLTTGDVVAYLNAGDTYVDANTVAAVVRVFETSPVEAVFGNVAIVDQGDSGRVVRTYRSTRFRPSRVAYGFMPAHPTLFLRRSVYERFGEYDTSFRIAGDFELVARVFGRGNVAFVCLPSTLVRMPRGGLSTAGPRSNWIITKEMKRACQQNGIPTNYLKLALRIPVKLTEMWGAG